MSIQSNTVLFLEVDFPFDVFEEGAVTSFKAVILVDVLSIIMAYFPESVHVELPDKRGEVVVLEESGQNSLSKLTDAFNVEGVVGGGPANDLVDRRVLNECKVTSSMSISF